MARSLISFSLVVAISQLLLAGVLLSQDRTVSGGVNSTKPPRARLSPAVFDKLVVAEKTSPNYPPEAKAAGVERQVKLRLVVGADGSLKSVSVVDGPALLVAAAKESVSRWKFKPFLLNGTPVDAEGETIVRFSR